jgi:DnaJ-domain-containing protein 1
MADSFAILNEPRRPWIDLEVLKAKFVALSTEVHPDRMHNHPQGERDAANQHFADLNAAYHCLCEPKERLAHLLELELGTKPEEVQKIPAKTADLFMEVSRVCSEADALLDVKSKLTSPVLMAQWFEKGITATDRLKSLQERLDARRYTLTAQLMNLNLAWESAPSVGCSTRLNMLPCGRLEAIYRDFSYLTRWTQQIRERIVQLIL